MNEHETSAAIADETVIDAIEGAQAVDAVAADESSNPADRRLPLIFRIYGIIMLVEGVSRCRLSCLRPCMRYVP